MVDQRSFFQTPVRIILIIHCTKHQPAICRPSTNHQPTTRQPPANHQPTISKTVKPLNQLSTNHQPTTNQPSTNHSPTISLPLTNHQPTINQPGNPVTRLDQPSIKQLQQTINQPPTKGPRAEQREPGLAHGGPWHHASWQAKQDSGTAQHPCLNTVMMRLWQPGRTEFAASVRDSCVAPSPGQCWKPGLDRRHHP